MCSDIDYGLLGGEQNREPSEPPEGTYQATLVVAKVVETSRGTALVTEWSTETEPPYYWTAWFGFAANRIAITNELLDGIGVDRAAIVRGGTQEQRDEELTRQLWAATNKVYAIEVTRWSGGVNTKVIVAPEVSPDQTQMWDAPISTEGLPAAGVGAAGHSEDDDIPF
jgi:hypothetical protein